MKKILISLILLAPLSLSASSNESIQSSQSSNPEKPTIKQLLNADIAEQQTIYNHNCRTILTDAPETEQKLQTIKFRAAKNAYIRAAMDICRNRYCTPTTSIQARMDLPSPDNNNIYLQVKAAAQQESNHALQLIGEFYDKPTIMGHRQSAKDVKFVSIMEQFVKLMEQSNKSTVCERFGDAADNLHRLPEIHQRSEAQINTPRNNLTR